MPSRPTSAPVAPDRGCRSAARLGLVLLAGCAGPGAAPGDTADTALPGWLTGPAPVACDAPLPSPTWTDRAREWRLGGEVVDPDTEHGSSAGAAYADLDGDGDDDVALAYAEAPVTLYLREGDGFTLGPTLPVGETRTRAVGVLDPDGDGAWDLFVATQDPRYALFRNDGAGRFTDATDTLVLPGPRANNLPSPGDWDADGDLDAYLPVTDPSSRTRVDQLLRNDDGVLAPIAGLPPAEGGATLQAAWIDVDDDGDRDVYAVNDFGPQLGGNALFRNDGAGGFTDASAACACTATAGGMSAEVGDVDGDLLPDLYVANSDGNNLFLNLGDGTFADVATAVGVREHDTLEPSTMVWSAILADFGNDGRLDVFNAHGDFFSALEPFTPVDAPSSLFQQAPDGTFVDIAPGLGMDTVSSDRSLVADDMNGDGVLDLLVTVVDDWPHLWLSDGCTAAGWLDVEIRQDGGNPTALGARVEIEAAGRTQVAWMQAESGINATRAPRVHFGLGDTDTVDRLRVTLPDGEELAVEVPFAGRRRIVIDRRE